MKIAASVLEPALRLADIFPAGLTFNPREPYGGNPFVPEDSPASDALTGGALPICGSMAMMCHRAVAGDHVLDLIAAAGFRCETSIEKFAGEADYRALLEAHAPRSVIFQHAHPGSAVSSLLGYVPGELLSYLNDKSNLPRLVPAHTLPRRRTLPMPGAGKAPWTVEPWQSLLPPMVLKVPSGYSLGSGEGVRICRGRGDISMALAEFEAAACLIAEEYLELRENWCVQFACLPGGGVRYLGSAEQVVDADGRYQGNWIGSREPSGMVIDLGWDVATRGSATGYAGVAGFDIAITADGRPVVLDLNFRINGSTLGLAYRESLFEQYGPMEILVRSVRDTRGWDHLRGALSAPGAGIVLPYAGYDPAAGDGGGTARASILIGGPDRNEVLAAQSELMNRGLT